MASPEMAAAARLGVLALTICLVFSPQALLADQVIEDDLIVVGNNCVGGDCVNGEVFNDSELRLKENNLRIRWFSGNAPDVLAKSWELVGNASQNGGGSFIKMEAKSLSPLDGFYVSDGFSEGYDCVIGDAIDTNNPPPTVVFPFGEQVTSLDFASQTCIAATAYVADTALKVGPENLGYVALGNGSQPEVDRVTVGTSLESRPMKHVAEPVEATDVIRIEDLQGIELLQVRRTQIVQLEEVVANLSAEVEALLQADADGDGIPNGLDARPLSVRLVNAIPADAPWALIMMMLALMLVGGHRLTSAAR